jgi:hypothetical protein
LRSVRIGNDDDAASGAISLQRCAVCQDEAAAWVHELDPELSRFRVYGKGHVWGTPAVLGEYCEVLLRRGDIEALAARHYRTREVTPEDVDEGIRNGLVALQRADLGSVPMGEWVPAGVVDAAQEGFVPLGDLTGDPDVASEWPEAHCRAVPESRPGSTEFSDDGMYWMVRSPWQGIAIQDVIRLRWEWLEERHPLMGRVTPEDESARHAAGREFMRLDDASVGRFASEHLPE